METNRPEQNRPLATGPGMTMPTSETRRPESAGVRDTASNIAHTAKDIVNRGAEVYGQTKQAVSQAYDKTSEALSHTYDQAMVYGRENPGKLTLIAFGAGIGVGLLLANAGTRRPRAGRYAEPVVTALSDIALEFFRHR